MLSANCGVCMADKRQLEFFVLRYVPDVVREEFVNVGLVMIEPSANGAGFADVRFTRDWRRTRCLDPQVDVEMLEALERDIRVQLGDVHERGVLLRRLEDSFSNVIQLSPTKGCLAEEPRKELEVLASLYFGDPKRMARAAVSGRRRILQSMQDAFERSGAWTLLMKGIPVEMYTKPGDPLKVDFGYQVGGTLKLFHAVSLKASVDQAIMLASRYPKIADSMSKLKRVVPFLTAVVDDDLNREPVEVRFALEALEEARIRVAVPADMPEIAERARRDLQA
jgi:Protein of unknown function (DUF3037)